MAKWIPKPGTMYRTLFDQCVEVFDIRENSAIMDSLICFGDPAGIACQCRVESSEFLVRLRTPQSYGHQPPPRRVQYWQDRWRQRKQTTGLLHVGRLAPTLSSHFDWIDPVAIVQGFGISATSIEINLAAAALSRLSKNDEWFSPQLRHDGAIELVSTSMSDPRAVRLATLFRNHHAHVTVWEITSRCRRGLGWK